MKRVDYFVISVLLLIGIILSLFIFLPSKEEEGQLEVRQNGKVLMTLSLEQDTQKTVLGQNGGSNTFSIQNGTVTMLHADCGDHTCIQTGSIHKTGESIVCLPHRLVLQIQKKETKDEITPDAIVR